MKNLEPRVLEQETELYQRGRGREGRRGCLVPSRARAASTALLALGFACRSVFYPVGEGSVLFPGRMSREKAGTGWKLNRA
jgi:hypothetical protein